MSAFLRTLAPKPAFPVLPLLLCHAPLGGPWWRNGHEEGMAQVSRLLVWASEQPLHRYPVRLREPVQHVDRDEGDEIHVIGFLPIGCEGAVHPLLPGVLPHERLPMLAVIHVGVEYPWTALRCREGCHERLPHVFHSRVVELWGCRQAISFWVKSRKQKSHPFVAVRLRWCEKRPPHIILSGRRQRLPTHYRRPRPEALPAVMIPQRGSRLLLDVHRLPALR